MTRHVFLAAILTLFIAQSTFAQTTISGSVKDKGGPIPGANIFIENTYDGGTSNENGNFSFEAFEEGPQNLVISFIGYEDFNDSIELNGRPIQLDIVLKEEFNELKAVVISAGAFEASDEGKAVVFKPLDIVTTAGAAGDIYGALGTLPGAQQVGNEEGLFVRGGAGYETKTIIDGLTVQNPYFSSVPDVPNRGRFSPFLFKGTVFSSGGYSAQYGQALSSAIVLNTSDMPNQTSSGLTLSPILAGAFHQQVWDKTAFSVGVNYFNTKLYNELVPQEIGYNKDPQGPSGSFSLTQKTSQTGLFKLYSTFSNNSLGIVYPSLNDTLDGFAFDLRNNNFYGNASWKEILGEDWTILVSASYSYNDDQLNFGGFDSERNDQAIQGRIALTDQITEKIKLRFGAEAATQKFASAFLGFDPLAQPFQDIKETYSAGFLESEFYITTDLAGRIGVRGEYSKALDEFNVAPRFSLAYKVGDNSQFNFAFGHFYQTPRPEYLSLDDGTLTFEKADHYIANYQYIKEDRTFRIEGYYKNYPTLSTINTDLSYGSLGNGYAGGIELFYRDKETITNADFWVSYSYINTKRKFLDYPELVRPPFAAEHVGSIVYKHFVPSLRSQIGATYSFQTGRPFHDPRSLAFMDGRTKTFNNLSVNVSYLTNIWDNFTVVFASFGNILGIDNIFGYRQFNPDGTILANYGYGLNEGVDFVELAQRPPAKRTFFVGMFISFNYTKKKNVPPPSEGTGVQ
ncbi:MAG: vitamin B12 transporter [Limisphaerales bacterium]|jgi:vitamin B12 transporter